MLRLSLFIPFLLVSLCFVCCNKEELSSTPQSPPAYPTLHVSYEVNGTYWESDTTMFQVQNGNTFILGRALMPYSDLSFSFVDSIGLGTYPVGFTGSAEPPVEVLLWNSSMKKAVSGELEIDYMSADKKSIGGTFFFDLNNGGQIRNGSFYVHRNN